MSFLSQLCGRAHLCETCILQLTQSLVKVLRASSVHTRETYMMVSNVYNKNPHQCFPLVAFTNTVGRIMLRLLCTSSVLDARTPLARCGQRARVRICHRAFLKRRMQGPGFVALPLSAPRYTHALLALRQTASRTLDVNDCDRLASAQPRPGGKGVRGEAGRERRREVGGWGILSASFCGHKMTQPHHI